MCEVCKNDIKKNIAVMFISAGITMIVLNQLIIHAK